MITCIRRHCCNITMALMRFFFHVTLICYDQGFFFVVVFLSLNLHQLCVLVMRGKIPPTALFSHFVIPHRMLRRGQIRVCFPQRNTQFFEVFSFDMKLNIAKSYLSSFKTFTCTGKFRLGRPQEVIQSRLLHEARSGQNLCKTCLVCDLQLEKTTQTHYSGLTQLSGSIFHSLPLLCSPPSPGVLQVCFRQVSCPMQTRISMKTEVAGGMKPTLGAAGPGRKLLGTELQA